MWKHPNYYKNLRKLYRSRNRDQAISLQAETSDARRTPGTGQTCLKQNPADRSGRLQALKPSSSQAREQASAQASSGARINKR